MEGGCQSLMSACTDGGLGFVQPFGGYFMLMDTAPLGLEFDTSEVGPQFLPYPFFLLIKKSFT